MLTRLDFVHDQEHVVGAADLLQPLDKSFGCGHVAALAEDGLENDACRVARRGLLLEQELELFEYRLGEDLISLARVICYSSRAYLIQTGFNHVRLWC